MQTTPVPKPKRSCKKCGSPLEMPNPFGRGHVIKDSEEEDGVCGYCLGKKKKVDQYVPTIPEGTIHPKERTIAFKEALLRKATKEAAEKVKRDAVAEQNRKDQGVAEDKVKEKKDK